jgi:ElaB/YqjD/DUF883 family membrane-anchored ribosome-binding protein
MKSKEQILRQIIIEYDKDFKEEEVDALMADCKALIDCCYAAMDEYTDQLRTELAAVKLELEEAKQFANDYIQLRERMLKVENENIELNELLQDSNSALRSTASIAERCGEHTNWEGISKKVAFVLSKQGKYMRSHGIKTKL